MKEFTTVTTRKMDDEGYDKLMSWAFKWYDLFALVTELAGNADYIYNEIPSKTVKMTKQEFEAAIQMEIAEGKTSLSAGHIGRLVSPIYFTHRFNGQQDFVSFADYVDGGHHEPEFDYRRYVTEEKSLKD